MHGFSAERCDYERFMVYGTCGRRPRCRVGGVWSAPGNGGSGNREDVYRATVSGPLVPTRTSRSERCLASSSRDYTRCVSCM
jgi:hypothetical protein